MGSLPHSNSQEILCGYRLTYECRLQYFLRTVIAHRCSIPLIKIFSLLASEEKNHRDSAKKIQSAILQLWITKTPTSQNSNF